MPRALTLVAIGLAAGFLSALFGVGGGIVMVPALVAWCAFGMKPATATSLAAIGVTAIVGATRYEIAGEIRWREAVLIGVPAIFGAVAGTALQRHLSAARLQLGFSLVILVTAAKLIAG